MKDYYALLGVGPDASPEEIRRTYRDLAQSAMWDRPRFTLLAEAWDVLKDPDKREVYTRTWRAAHEASGGGGTGAPAPAAATVATPPPPQAPPAAAAFATGNGSSGATVGGDAGAGATAMPPPLPHQAAQATIAMGAGEATGAGDATRAITLAPCPVCQTPGVPGEEFCPECGFLVGSTPGSDTFERPLPYLADTRNGQKYPLRVGENVVGRERGDVIVGDGTVSRRHARLIVQADGDVFLEDLGSTNGTQRAGVRLPSGQRAAVGDGTAIQFGAVKMTIHFPDAPLALPLPEAAPAAAAEEKKPEEPEPVAALTAPDGYVASPLPPAESNAAAEPVAKLVGAGGQVYALTETTTTFGRRSTNHFVLSGDPYVSGAHAQIVYQNHAFRLMDLGSTNGTSVNGKRLSPHAPEPVKDGDEIVLGRTTLRFHSKIGS